MLLIALVSIVTSSYYGFLMILWQVLIGGLVFGLFALVISLTFLVMGFKVPLFRNRFHECFRLRSMPVQKEEISGSSEQV
jgi:hypothetical protein